MRGFRILLWAIFFLCTTFRLGHFASEQPPSGIYRNSETVFAEYSEKRVTEHRAPPVQLKMYPNLAALYVAVWAGDLSLFPEEVKEFYRVTGTLAVLALSGQHVWILLGLLSSFISLFLRIFYWLNPSWAIKLYTHFRYGVRDLGLLLCALWLFVTSDGSASMLRTFTFCLSLFVLKRFGRIASAVQCLTTTTALLILIEPSWAFQTGYVLSFFGSLLVFLFEKKSVWATFLFPLLMYPLLAHFFGRVSLVASLLAFPIEGIWTVALIPLGFLLPLFLNPLALQLLNPMEKSLGLFYAIHSWVGALLKGVMPRVVIPNLWEVILLEIWGVGGALFLYRYWQKRTKSHRVYD